MAFSKMVLRVVVLCLVLAMALDAVRSHETLAPTTAGDEEHAVLMDGLSESEAGGMTTSAMAMAPGGGGMILEAEKKKSVGKCVCCYVSLGVIDGCCKKCQGHSNGSILQCLCCQYSLQLNKKCCNRCNNPSP